MITTSLIMVSLWNGVSWIFHNLPFVSTSQSSPKPTHIPWPRCPLACNLASGCSEQNLLKQISHSLRRWLNIAGTQDYSKITGVLMYIPWKLLVGTLLLETSSMLRNLKKTNNNCNLACSVVFSTTSSVNGQKHIMLDTTWKILNWC